MLLFQRYNFSSFQWRGSQHKALFFFYSQLWEIHITGYFLCAFHILEIGLKDTINMAENKNQFQVHFLHRISRRKRRYHCARATHIFNDLLEISLINCKEKENTTFYRKNVWTIYERQRVNYASYNEPFIYLSSVQNEMSFRSS